MQEMTQTNSKTEVTLDIDALTYGPYGIGRMAGKAVMIPNTVPGDRIAARLNQSRERYATADLLQLIEASPLRQRPPCVYAGECGGCSWQHIRYDAQLKAKQENVKAALRRIGKLSDFEMPPIIATENNYHYRGRIRLQCNGVKEVGFFRAFSNDIVEVHSCVIADDRLNEIIAPLRSYVKQTASTFDSLEIVIGDEPNERVLVGHVAGRFVESDAGLCQSLVAPNGPVEGIILRGINWRRTWGQTEITVFPEDGLRLKIAGDVFTQVNRQGNRRLLRELQAAAAFNETDLVLELYSGAGNLTLPIAKRVRTVFAVEGSKVAVESGERSAILNDVKNIEWLCSPVPAAVAQIRRRRQSFSKVVLDPPRSGAKGIEGDLASLGAAAIVYVSCNPTTLARDLAALVGYGYELRKVQAIDLFPHTFHVETIAQLLRR
jgi:23S rRNA (uracil1939-C5)-methyltransferase